MLRRLWKQWCIHTHALERQGMVDSAILVLAAERPRAIPPLGLSVNSNPREQWRTFRLPVILARAPPSPAPRLCQTGGSSPCGGRPSGWGVEDVKKLQYWSGRVYR